ncbi:MAG TPA: hypothetical protein VGQ83_39910 [Polyangia bacterium]|jgi:hypothetical protein
MFQWLLVQGDQRELVYRCFGAAWARGTACEALVSVGGTPIIVAWSQGARAQRAPRWPEVLADWHEFHDAEPLFPDDTLPVLAEEVAALGLNALALAVAPGAARATAAWYAQGALTEYEHAGAVAVAWYEGAGLGQPRVADYVHAAADVGKRLADSAAEAALYDRIDQGLAAEAGGVYRKALRRLLDAEPPACDDLAGLVARAPCARWRL